jgi:hypothetical protein
MKRKKGGQLGDEGEEGTMALCHCCHCWPAADCCLFGVGEERETLTLSLRPAVGADPGSRNGTEREGIRSTLGDGAADLELLHIYIEQSDGGLREEQREAGVVTDRLQGVLDSPQV